MGKYDYILFSFFYSFLIVTSGLVSTTADEDKKAYIVYLGSLPSDSEYSPSAHHFSLLQAVVDASSLHNSLITSYKRSFNGFAAMLTSSEKEKLERMEGVVSVFRSKTFQLHTTRSWDFIGLHENTDQNSTIGSDIIVGVIDTGIWPESESFSDQGFGPVPKKWKGACNGGQNFTCNKKIIGAKSFSFFGPADTPRDDAGHGTHTASTAAGSKVKDVSFYGLAQGTARGGVPSARIAVYKACRGNGGCFGVDILAAFDDAIADGVDIITISLGLDSATDFVSDESAIGSFHAMQKGILTANSAGNSGPTPGTVVAVAPWLLSVAASTTDRKIIDKVVLGNGTALPGSSINIFSLNGTKLPVVYGFNISHLCSVVGAQMCGADCLDESALKGKIVLCDQPGGITEAQRAGAVGAVLQANRYDNNPPSVVPFPASILSFDDYQLAKSYLSSTDSPQAEILRSESINDTSAPVVASFSSRGPNVVAPDILKPDISAPGIDILAAYIPFASIDGDDKTLIKYNIQSGTSMSCPHAAAGAAYVKAYHPDWSPSAIKSALMTTASPMKASLNSDAEFAYGSGHINPVKAINPGLIYEAQKIDYIKFLCSMGYTTEKIRLMSGDNSSCPDTNDKASSPRDLNYPSMAVKVFTATPFDIGFNRTVTNVGNPNSTYNSTVSSSDSELNIKVVPQVLSFKALNETKSFHVTVFSEGLPDRKKMVSASLVWSDGIHNVTSPIVVYVN